MPQATLYEALLVSQDATLDEIKLAFKRRALQVHPDKGGSKEAFHLVYQALETLADPEARKKYDYSLATARKKPAQPPPSASRRKKKATNKRKEAPSNPEKPSKWRKKAVPKAPQSKETKLLIKIRHLLKQLPRHVRNEVIARQFSQKQRLILEKWMVENCQTQTEQGPQEVAQATLPTDDLREPQEAALAVESQKTPPQPSNCSALVPFNLTPSPRTGKRQRDSKRKVGGIWGSFGAVAGYYRAGVRFDFLSINTGQCDLQTALEYLVILTSAKQKMVNHTSHRQTDVCFEKHLHEALVASANEHGKNIADLNLRFAVLQSCGILFGQSVQLLSPSVRSITKLAELRNCLRPFREYGKNLRGRSPFWLYSPAHLQGAWEQFQKALANMWEIAGGDGSKFMQKILARYDAAQSSRQKHLQSWERHHMAIQDKNKNRPWRFQDQSTKHLERRERHGMARHDKTKTRKRIAKDPKNTMLALSKLLARWEGLLERQASSAEKQHQKTLRLRRLQHSKDQKERKRLEILNRKRLREEERLRRETLRQRMRCSDFMDDLPWIGMNRQLFEEKANVVSGECFKYSVTEALMQ